MFLMPTKVHSSAHGSPYMGRLLILHFTRNRPFSDLTHLRHPERRLRGLKIDAPRKLGDALSVKSQWAAEEFLVSHPRILIVPKTRSCSGRLLIRGQPLES
jgi:hypothetical protein